MKVDPSLGCRDDALAQVLQCLDVFDTITVAVCVV